MINIAFSNLHSSLRIARVASVLLLLNSSAISQQVVHFDFGPTKTQLGHERVGSDTFYSKALGYGFEPDARISCVESITREVHSGFCTSEKPFYFSVALPEGNYFVRITFGDFGKESRTTVKAELRRLMLERVDSPAGKFVTRTFVVNVRTPAIPGGGEVKLKDREKTTEAWAWDEKLTLEFNNSIRPSAQLKLHGLINCRRFICLAIRLYAINRASPTTVGDRC
jgi:hypothetical protein